ncbi:hypothetical protein [Streptacidiphilus carbonis]|uniref:hypothetical protein n=1 Tax=Streptacidiphilus carbonis TaxID=105422 RepID=UPI00126A415D|nr:hypothetical protein [Streptacidiphilus carbonis]
MDTNYEAAPGGRTQNQVPTPQVTKVAGGAHAGVEKGVTADLITAVHAIGGPAAVGAAAKYGLQYGASVVNTVVTQRAETHREQLRQAGETERARIAQQAATPPQLEPPVSE